MNAFQSWFNKIVTYLENSSTPFRRYVFLFFAILFVRLVLEFFSNNRLFRLEDIVHIGLWFMFIVSAFLIQLHLFSGESITKVFKVVVVCFSIALSAPIIDLIISHGMGVKMNYLSINSINDIVFSYFTMGGSSLNRGATIGIRVEIVILLIASFNYIYSKTKKILRTCIGTFCIYTILFFSGTLPYLISKLASSLSLKFEVEDNSSILMLLLLNLLTIGSIVYRKYAALIISILKRINWLTALIVIILFISGGLSALRNYPDNWQLNPSNLFCIPLIGVLFVLFLMFHAYLKTKEEAIITEKYYVENALFIFITCISFAISSSVFFLSLVLWAVLFLSYEAPLQLQKIKYLNNLLAGFLSVGVVLLGFVFFNAPMVGFSKQLIVLIIWIVFSSELIRSQVFAKVTGHILTVCIFLLFTLVYCYYNFEVTFLQLACVALIIHYCLLILINKRYEITQSMGYLVLSILLLYYLITSIAS